MNRDFDEATWLQVWQSANNISVCNRTKETQFRLIRCLQITPQLRHRMDQNKSDLCLKCNAEPGSFIHCIWTYKYTDDDWENIVNRLCFIFGIKLSMDLRCLLFGLADIHLIHSIHCAIWGSLRRKMTKCGDISGRGSKMVVLRHTAREVQRWLLSRSSDQR